METKRASTANGFSALTSGTVLDRYRIDSVIAAGGFGITYLCQHVTLGKAYALKEHFPRQFAYREGSTSAVRPTDPDTFSWALDRFIQEGRSLAKCSHPNVVGVADVFEANSTAYMVLDYEQGQSLRAWLDQLGRAPTQDEIDRLLVPLLDALDYVHGRGLLHRDIAPDNIVIRPDGSPCLIDFGSARQAVAERSHVMSAVVKSGYSPPEQYTRSGRAQGPWSDIYALGATLYRAITRITPPEAPDRQVGDDLRPVASLLEDPARYRPGFLAAIDAALALKHGDRPQTVAAWRQQLFATGPRPAQAGRPPLPAATTGSATAIAAPAPPRTEGRHWHMALTSVLALAVVALGILWWSARRGEVPSVAGASLTTEAPGGTQGRGAEPLVAAAEARRKSEEERRLARVEATRQEDEARAAQATAARAAAEAEARSKAEQEAAERERRRLAAEAEAAARRTEQERLQAEAAARRRAEERAAAEARVRAEAQAAAEARQRAEAELRTALEEEARRRAQVASAAATQPQAADQSGQARATETATAPIEPPPTTDNAVFARAVQSELKRLGCYQGDIDGDWGSASQRAFETYLKRTNAPAASAPAPAHLETARKLKERVCPLVCDSDERLVDGRCIARVRPRPPTNRSPQAAERTSPSAPKKAEPNCGAYKACLALYRPGHGEIHCNRPPGC